MNKLIVVAAAVLTGLIVVFLIISARRWQQHNPPTQSSQPTPMPLEKASKKPTFTFPTPLSVNLTEITRSLPYVSSDLKIEYSPILEQIIVTYQTPEAKDEFDRWIAQQNLSTTKQDLIDQKIMVITTPNGPSYQKEGEDIYARNRELNLILIPTVAPVIPTPLISTSPETQSLRLLADLLSLLFTMQTTLPSQPAADLAVLPTTASQALSVSPAADASAAQTPVQTVNDNVRLIVPADSMKKLFIEVGEKVGVPAKIIEGVMQIESQGTLAYSDDKVINYSTPGNSSPGCAPNSCSATGPMQMTTGRDGNGRTDCPKCCWNGKCVCPNAWAGYGRAVNTYGSYSHNPNPCNLRDNLYAAGLKLKNNSAAVDPTSWTQEEVHRAGLHYNGSCSIPYPRLGNRTYCEFLWWYYKK